MTRLLLLAVLLFASTARAEPSPYDALTDEQFLELGRQGLRKLEEQEAKERQQHQQNPPRAPERCPRAPERPLPRERSTWRV